VGAEEADEPGHEVGVLAGVEDAGEPAAGLEAGGGELPDGSGHVACCRDEPAWTLCGLVDEEREVLAAEDLDGIEVAAGGDDVAGDHQLGIVQEVQRPRVTLGEGGDEGVTGLASGPADALHVVRLGRWNGGEHDRREVADVDAHLQGRRGGEDVGCVGAPAVLEAGLDPLPTLAGEHPGVLGGDDSADPSGAVEVPVEVRREGGGWLVPARAAQA
jgi:hypothetical protein